MPQAADGMRIEPPVSVPTDAEAHAFEQRDRRAAARAAGRSRRIARMPHGAERRLLARRAERELVQVGLADDDGARLAQARDDGASASGCRGGTADPAVVGVPATSTRSFTEIGMPCSGPR